MSLEKNNFMNKIGAHVSTSGGFSKAIERAVSIGANTIQIFGASPVQWKANLPDPEEAKIFQTLCQKNDIGPVFLHAPYLINLASPKEELVKLSKELLKKHLEISNSLGARGVIFHIGSKGERDQKEAEKIVAKSLSDILKNVKEGILFIENCAGAGNLIGDTLEEIGSIIKRIKNSRIGFCLDTAHAFESGILADFETKTIKSFVKKIEKEIGLEKFEVIHANDSKTPMGSNKDRHENIGQGFIGKKGFINLFKNKEIIKRSFILEVPGFDGLGPDKKNIDILRKCSIEI